VLRYRHGGKRHDAGLGAYPLFTLADARTKANEMRRQLAGGVDPLSGARRNRQGHLFERVAGDAIDALSAGWHGSRRRQSDQWWQSLRDHAFPTIGEMPVQAIDTAAVLQCLRPIWATKNRTANRVRARIEAVLNFAVTAGLREPGDNPARWRGHLSNVLAQPSRVQQVAHHKALPYAEMPAFMAELRQSNSTIALALRFLIVTAARTGEVLGAR